MNTAKKKTKATEAPQDLITATKSGDRLETLIALRDLLAEKLQNTASARDVSAMARRLMQCVAEIEAIDKERKARGTFSLDDFRREMRIYTPEKPNKGENKKIMENKKRIDKDYQLGKLAGEHESY